MTQTKKSFCPGCFYLFDWCSVWDPSPGVDPLTVAPIDGDPSVCLNCGRLLIYRGNQAQAATASDVNDLMSDREAWRKVEQIRSAILQRGLLHPKI